ncbi:transposase [Bradyrhizobium sp. CCGUVB1N3]|nr:transposase [Bradyrhizobium sp. CCGUVB1N3]MCP3476653.1 transposase [Bradyrhizobium sp. CCGUVB1N3]
MIKLLERIIGVGIETVDRVEHECLSRQLRDRRAVARYASLTGAPDESGKRRREKGLRAGNARVRRGTIQLAWRPLLFQKDSALAQWFRARAAGARGCTRKTMIVALARKLLIAFWRLTTTGEIPAGIELLTGANPIHVVAGPRECVGSVAGTAFEIVAVHEHWPATAPADFSIASCVGRLLP